jgi:MFS family permease
MFRKYLSLFIDHEPNLWVLLIGWFASALGFAASFPFIAIYFKAQYGLRISEIGLFFGVLAIVRAVFQIIGGEIADRVERRRLLICLQVFRALAFLLLALAIKLRWEFWPMCACLLVSSIFGALFHPTANTVVSDILPEEKRLHGYALTRTAGNLGWAAGPAIGGFLAASSYGLLFLTSSIITLISGLVYWAFLKVPRSSITTDRFRLRDMIAVKDDPYMAVHSFLIFLLYLVVAQLIVPFSVFAVRMVGISHTQLGFLYTLNGLLVVALQIPVTRFLSRYTLSLQIAWGAFLYAFGYGMLGILIGFKYFALAITVVTLGEMFMSPASLALTSRLAPEERMGRYMGMFGFVLTAGWSFGPLYGGAILDHFGQRPAEAWMLIASMAVLSGAGYLLFGRKLPADLDSK